MQQASTASVATGSANQTFRTIMKPSVGSRGTVRLRLSNLYGSAPVTITSLHLGLVSSGASVESGSDVAVTFGGSASTTIAAGATVTTDTVPLTFSYGALVAATLYVAGSTASLPTHNGFGQVADFATASGAGNETSDLAGTTFTPTATTVLIDRLDLYGDYIGTVAFAGSSTTLGYGTPAGSYEGFVDTFAADLHAAGRDDLAIANMSIAPDSLLAANDVLNNKSIVERLNTDFLSLPSIRTIVQNGGDVDLKGPRCDTLSDIIAGDRQIIAQSHAVGVRVVLAVIAPSTYCNGQVETDGSRWPAGYGSDGIRDDLNSWIDSTAPTTLEGMTFQPPGADAVVDLSTPVTDPSDTGYLLPVYDYFDHSHVTAAGQARQAAAINVTSL